MSDLISRQAAIEAVFDWEMTYDWDEHCREEDPKPAYIVSPSDVIEQLPSAQPEPRYTEEELRVFQHGISLSLLSKRSAQHWHYDEDTATEIKFLERLYEKVGADMRGEQDEMC